MSEREARRPGWTNGCRIILGDGTAWYFPKIDFVLMAATSLLHSQMAEVFRLALETQQKTDGTEKEFQAALYHTRMLMLAITLLRINYDLTDLEWARLTQFTSPQELISFSERTSIIFVKASEIWMPFLATCGPNGSEVLSLN